MGLDRTLMRPNRSESSVGHKHSQAPLTKKVDIKVELIQKHHRKLNRFVLNLKALCEDETC